MRCERARKGRVEFGQEFILISRSIRSQRLAVRFSEMVGCADLPVSTDRVNCSKGAPPSLANGSGSVPIMKLQLLNAEILKQWRRRVVTVERDYLVRRACLALVSVLCNCASVRSTPTVVTDDVCTCVLGYEFPRFFDVQDLAQATRSPSTQMTSRTNYVRHSQGS